MKLPDGFNQECRECGAECNYDGRVGENTSSYTCPVCNWGCHIVERDPEQSAKEFHQFEEMGRQMSYREDEYGLEDPQAGKPIWEPEYDGEQPPEEPLDDCTAVG